MLLNSEPVCLYLPQPISLPHLYRHPVDIDLIILVWLHHFIFYMSFISRYFGAARSDWSSRIHER